MEYRWLAGSVQGAMNMKFQNIRKVFSRTQEPDRSEPLVLLDLLKNHCRLPTDLTADDDYLIHLLKTAEQKIESWAEISLRSSPYTLNFRSLPTQPEFCTDTHIGVRLEVVPVTEIVSVKYYDSEGNQQTLDPSDYALVDGAVPGCVLLPADTEACVSGLRPLPWQVNFLAGYESLDDVPSQAKELAMLLVGHWYRFREAIGSLPGSESGSVRLLADSLLADLCWRI